MMIINQAVLLFTVALIMISCASTSEDRLKDPAHIQSEILITLGRANTFGLGPTYQVWITAEGDVLYEGYAYVDKTGFHTRSIGKDEVLALVDSFRQAGILELKDPYRPTDCQDQFTDAAQATFSIRLNGVRHQVEHDYGCTGFVHEQDFFRLEELIDRIAQTDQWVGARARR